MKQILFVDDEQNVLEGLARMLRGMRHEWKMTFLSDPLRAAALLEQPTFDAIVVDMRMPQMDGAELLARARERSPGTARIVLSGHAEREAALRSVGLAHQFLAKPCNADTLRTTVARVCGLRGLLLQAGLADLVCEFGALPSLPRLYHEITEELARDEVALKRVAAIVGQDVAMTARVLQLVNSAFFGLGRRVGTMEEAVSYLGVDVLRALAASHTAFVAFEGRDLSYLNDLWRHSLLTGLLAKAIGQGMSSDRLVHGEALQAGMLHDIGALILATRMAEQHRQARERSDGAGVPLATAEREIFNCDHGHVGAYLMGLWGLSDRIVEALAYHDIPGDCAFRSFAPLTAVHIASVLMHEAVGTTHVEASLDVEYLGSCGCLERLPQWRTLAQQIVDGNGACQ